MYASEVQRERVLPSVNSEVATGILLLVLSLTNLDHFFKKHLFLTSTLFPQYGSPGSVVSWWRFSAVVVAFLLIQQASIPQGSRVEIRVSRESRAALALSDSHALRQSI